MARLRLLPLLILLLAIFGWGSDADVTRTSTVAVMPLVGQGVDEASSQVATDALSDELLRTGKVRVMERSQMESILKEQGFQHSGACDGAECAVQVGKLLSIGKMVVGTLGRIGSTYSLSVRIVDVETGEVVGSVRRLWRGEIDQAVSEVIPAAAQEIAAQISGAPMSNPSATTERTVVAPLDPLAAPVAPVAPVAPIPEAVVGADTLWPTKDAVVDPEGWNLGFDSDVRLMYAEGLVLIDFGDVPRLLKKRQIAHVSQAYLELSAWMALMAPVDTIRQVGLELGTVSQAWEEGTGNWFWNRGQWQNHYQTAYAWYPNYAPPPGSDDPATAPGIRWSNSATLRQSFRSFAKAQVSVGYVAPNYFPRQRETTPLRLDVTQAVRQMQTTGEARTLAIRLDVPSQGRQSFDVSFFTKDHYEPKVSGPRLVLR